MKLLNHWRLDLTLGGQAYSLGVATTWVIGAIPTSSGWVQYFGLWDLEDGTVAFSGSITACSCTNGGPFFSSRQYFGQPHGVITLTEYRTNNCECTIGSEEQFKLVPTGDGRVALYSLSEGRADSTSNAPDPGACRGYLSLVTDQVFGALRENWLAGGYGDAIGNAITFSVVGRDRLPFLDILQVNKSGIGLLVVEDLTGMNFTGWTITDLDLRHAKSLVRCNFSNANLQRANLTGRTDLATMTLAGADLSGANLEGCDLRSLDLSHVNFSGANLRGVNLENNTTLSGARFDKADLRGGILRGANFQGTDLSGAILSGSSLGGCKLGGANLTGTDLSNTDLTEVDFTGLEHPTDSTQPTNLSNSTLHFSAIGLDWSFLDLTGAKISGVPTDLSRLNASCARLHGLVFDGHTLDGAVFASATLDGASFVGARMRKAKFNGARLLGSVFTKAALDDCQFNGAALGGTDRNAAAILSGAYIANCDFTGCDLYGVSFANATIIGANVFGHSANLQETNFGEAYLASVDLSGANLRGARLDRAFMVESVLSGADLSPTRDGSVRSSLTFACLQGATFDGVNLAGADLSNAAITAQSGSILQQYIDSTGQLTPATPINYAGTPLPNAASFSAETVCPNEIPFASNQRNGTSMSEMMVGRLAPTSWKPAGAQ